MNQRRLTANDICKVIAACSSNRVKKIDIEGLKISFYLDPTDIDPEKINFPVTPSAAIPNGEEKNALEIMEGSKLAERLSEEQEDQEDLLLIDPEEMERQIASGEAIDAEQTSEA